MLSDTSGKTLDNLLPDIVITPVQAPAPAAAAPTTLKERKHLAEVECQRTSKAQRIALDAVRSAQQEVEQARQKVAAKENLLEEARAALALASKETEAALTVFNEVSRAFQAEVALAAAAAAPAKDPGNSDGGASNRSASQDRKRTAPKEADAVNACWEQYKINVRDALASGDQEAAKAATQHHFDALVRLQQEELDAIAARRAQETAGAGLAAPAAADVDGAAPNKKPNTGQAGMEGVTESVVSDSPAAEEAVAALAASRAAATAGATDGAAGSKGVANGLSAEGDGGNASL